MLEVLAYGKEGTALKFLMNVESIPLGKIPQGIGEEISLDILSNLIVKLKGEKNRVDTNIKSFERILQFYAYQIERTCLPYLWVTVNTVFFTEIAVHNHF